jgi:hypothetical protein
MDYKMSFPEAQAVRLPRVRFTMRRMMVMVAIMALPLAGTSQAIKWSVVSHARRDKAEEFQRYKATFDRMLYRGDPGKQAYYQSMSHYYRLMEEKYHHAAERPWDPVTPDPPIPPKPW